MEMILRIIRDSMAQAFQQLRSNKLRTLLSLLGVTIGIFCIIAVLSAVDSLERNIRESFEKLGDDVLYISKMPWAEDPNRNYWKYMRRPNPNLKDYDAVLRKCKSADLISFSSFIGAKNLKHESSSLNGVFLLAVTKDYPYMFNMEFEDGRFYSSYEFESGSDKVVIGHEVAQNLFKNTNPVGKHVKLMGRKVQVIGVIKKSGDDLINPVDFDWIVIVSYPLGKKFSNLDSPHMFGTSLAVKAKENVNLDRLIDEVTIALRSVRRLKPKEADNFAINELSILSSLFDQFFGVLNGIGFIIGFFALIVGAFSVANIMFVSVKERTKQIGIKKALGARKSVILLEFLIESIILCILGGLIGLGFVFVILKVLTAVTPNFEFGLSIFNILLGVFIATIIGLIAGFIPAFVAARMDPVDAMRK
jgi:putative ABC transport system permease protein